MSTNLAAPPREITPDELLAMPDGEQYELVDGRLVKLNRSLLSSNVEGAVYAALHSFSSAHQLGWVFSSGNQYRCFPWKPNMIRKPDASFVRRERLTLEQVHADGFCTVAPDLAVEVVSTHDLAAELLDKISIYRRAGVSLIWVIDPMTRVAQVHRLAKASLFLFEDDELDGEEVLPGFRIRLGALLPPAVAVPAESGG
jgi:Uma2 family endonuclease